MTKKEKIKQKWEDFRWKAKLKAKAAKEWVVENKEICMLAAPVVLKVGKDVYKAHQKTARQKWEESERKRIDTTYYDPKTGLHWRLKREPTNEERAIIDRRRKEGHDAYEILLALGLV